MDHIAQYVDNINEFRKLDFDTQLNLVGDIIAYWGEAKIDALDEAGKTRVDTCLPAQRFYNIEKMWDNYQLNLKKRADIENNKLRRGV